MTSQLTSAQNRLYQWQGLGWRFSSARLRMANDTVTSLAFLFSDDPKWERIGEAYLSYYASAHNHHEIYLSVQCDILCNCCPSIPTTSVYNDSRCIISFLRGSGFETVTDLPPAHPHLCRQSPMMTLLGICNKCKPISSSWKM